MRPATLFTDAGVTPCLFPSRMIRQNTQAPPTHTSLDARAATVRCVDDPFQSKCTGEQTGSCPAIGPHSLLLRNGTPRCRAAAAAVGGGAKSRTRSSNEQQHTSFLLPHCVRARRDGPLRLLHRAQSPVYSPERAPEGKGKGDENETRRDKFCGFRVASESSNAKAARHSPQQTKNQHPHPNAARTA
jgi:hypothetical protein